MFLFFSVCIAAILYFLFTDESIYKKTVPFGVFFLFAANVLAMIKTIQWAIFRELKIDRNQQVISVRRKFLYFKLSELYSFEFSPDGIFSFREIYSNRRPRYMLTLNGEDVVRVGFDTNIELLPPYLNDYIRIIE